MVSSTSKVSQKSVKNFSQVQYDQIGKKIWNKVKYINDKIIGINKSNPGVFQYNRHSSITPTHVWVHDSVRMNVR